MSGENRRTAVNLLELLDFENRASLENRSGEPDILWRTTESAL